MKTVINSFGTEIDFDVAVVLMDEDIREELAFALAPCTDQAFFDAYCKAHEDTYGSPFVLDEKNPQY